MGHKTLPKQTSWIQFFVVTKSTGFQTFSALSFRVINYSLGMQVMRSLYFWWQCLTARLLRSSKLSVIRHLILWQLVHLFGCVSNDPCFCVICIIMTDTILSWFDKCNHCGQLDWLQWCANSHEVSRSENYKLCLIYWAHKLCFGRMMLGMSPKIIH